MEMKGRKIEGALKDQRSNARSPETRGRTPQHAKTQKKARAGDS
jgi:hypothetical protein